MYRPINSTDTEPRCPVCNGGDIHSFSCARANPPAMTNYHVHLSDGTTRNITAVSTAVLPMMIHLMRREGVVSADAKITRIDVVPADAGTVSRLPDGSPNLVGVRRPAGQAHLRGV